jgi:spore germination cell wall hydrolase CwlJ-like protein
LTPAASETLFSYQFVLLALVLWREARDCSRAEKLAIAHVIHNRTTDPAGRWPRTLSGVICQPMQFTSIAPPAHVSPAEMANATTWPKESDPHWLECCQIADEFASSVDSSDPTRGATNYYSTPISSVPAWADESKMTLQLGVFRFFRL